MKTFPPLLNFVATLPCKTNTSVNVRVKLEVLRRETPDFISPDLWPTNSPDLNPVDYGWLGGTTGSASDQRSEGCEFEAY